MNAYRITLHFTFRGKRSTHTGIAYARTHKAAAAALSRDYDVAKGGDGHCIGYTWEPIA